MEGVGNTLNYHLETHDQQDVVKRLPRGDFNWELNSLQRIPFAKKQFNFHHIFLMTAFAHFPVQPITKQSSHSDNYFKCICCMQVTALVASNSPFSSILHLIYRICHSGQLSHNDNLATVVIFFNINFFITDFFLLPSPRLRFSNLVLSSWSWFTITQDLQPAIRGCRTRTIFPSWEKSHICIGN